MTAFYPKTFRWAPQHEEQLRSLAASGYSATQIAERMGLSSRNTVLGKAHHLGVRIGHARIKQKPTLPDLEGAIIHERQRRVKACTQHLIDLAAERKANKNRAWLSLNIGHETTVAHFDRAPAFSLIGSCAAMCADVAVLG